MALDFSRNYSPPGVYIEESDSTLVSSTGIPPTLVAIVGPARGYQVNVEQVVFGDTAVRLAKQGIDTTSAVVSVATSGLTVPATDYTLTKVGGTTAGNDHQVDLLAGSNPSVPKGTTVFISYRYTDPSYYLPRRFDNFEDVKDVYGEPLNTAVAVPGDTSYQYVTSHLALAAMKAFENGATELWLVAATPPPGSASTDAAKSTAARTSLKAAYAKLDSNPEVNVLVAVTSGIAEADASGTITDLRTALESSSQDGFFRFGIIGFDAGVTSAPDLLLNTSGARSKRLMLAYAGPAALLMYSGGANASFAVGHQFLAAAYAGRMAALPVQYAITKQVISGFSGLAGTPLSNSLKNQYSASGVAVAEIDRFSRLTVRHGVTTDTTNVNTRESAVVRAKDAMVTALQDGMSVSGLIGAPIDSDMLLNVKSAVQGILESATADEVIVEYSSLAVRQTSNDPSVIEVKFAYKPAYPLNYIVISFSIDMSTGVTDLTTDDTATA